jgi:hypothetical protein
LHFGGKEYLNLVEQPKGVFFRILLFSRNNCVEINRVNPVFHEEKYGILAILDIRLARKMVLEWGMSESLGQMALGDGGEHVFLGHEIAQRREYSEATAREADEEIKKILKKAYDQAVEVLKQHRDGLDRVAQDLIEKEEIPGKEVMELVGVKRPQPSVEKPTSIPGSA